MNRKLSVNCSEILPNPSLYKRLIGRRIYLTNTRPDIIYVVNYLSQFVSVSKSIHHQAVMRILQYLKHTPRKGLFLATNSETQLKGYSD